MITKTYKTILFVSSFLPLYIILIVKFYEFDKTIKFNLVHHTEILLVMTTLIIISVITFLYFLMCEMNKEKEFGQVENVNSEILSYFITYIVPLTTLEENNINSIFINLLLFLVIGIFYVNGNQFYMNILFTLFGFNVYKDENNAIIISKKSADKISDRSHVKVKQVGYNVFLINKK